MIKRYGSAVAAGLLLVTASCSSRNPEQASLREPDNAARLRVAATAAAAGQTDIALSMYTAAAAAAPRDPDVQARLASTLLRAGRPEEADQTLTRALAERPNNPLLLRWLGNLRLETGSPEAALQIFDDLIARKKTDVASLNGRGVALDMLNRHAEAQKTYLAAQSISPDDLQTANNLAVSYLLDQRPAAARDTLAPFIHRADLPPRVSNNYKIAEAALGSAPSGESATLPADDLKLLAASLGPALNPAAPAPTVTSPSPTTGELPVM